MLYVICGRENLNKEKFAFERIRENAIVIVPEQYTLEGEKDALKYQNRQGIAETEVLSFSRLGSKVFKKLGMPQQELLDKQGRHILISKIIREKIDELEVFKNQKEKTSFVEMLNNFISQLKTNGVSLEELANVCETLDEESFARRKLADVITIYKEYEKEIEGKYTDSEDYVDLFAAKIKDLPGIENKDVLIYGFDYFTPKNLIVIEELIKYSKDVYIVLTLQEDSKEKDYDNFAITNKMRLKLHEISKKVSSEYFELSVPAEYSIKKSKELLHLEKEGFALPAIPYKEKCENIVLLRAANYYLEAESAATFFLELVRDKGLRYREIALICNDLSERGDIFKRVFNRYGINIFVDEKSGINTQPLIRYILVITEIKSKGFKKEDMIRLLKTGLTGVENYNEIELLEQFAMKYNISGNKWKSKFPVWEENEDEYATIEEARKILTTPLLELFDKMDKQISAKGKIEVLYDHLRNIANIPQKLERHIEEFVEEKKNEDALFQRQVYKTVIDVFEQLIEVAGEDKMNIKEIGELVKSGFDSVALAIVPPTADMSILGTVQRTRTSQIKALMVLGANEGVLPKEIIESEILTEEEKESLAEKDINLLKLKQLKQEEEELAIYKMLSKPTEYLWMSYSVSNCSGEEMKPAKTFEMLEEIFPNANILEDIENRKKSKDLISTEGSTIYYLSQNIREFMDGKRIDPVWFDVARWYDENKSQEYETMKKALKYTNSAAPIHKENIKKIHSEKNTLSPSRIEKYARCPFSHFVKYVLKPKGEKKYIIESADVGTIYHEVLMIMAAKLTTKGIKVCDPNSHWITVNKEESDEMAQNILDEVLENYRKGVVKSAEEEKNKAELMAFVCKDSAWAMIQHVKSGKIEEILFEQEFGDGHLLEPIKIEISKNQKVYIEGKIDRVDMLPEGYVKVIDYKSSNMMFDREKASKGWSVQLFLYLEAASNPSRKPAGTFYFHINSPIIDATYTNEEDVMEKFWLDYRMDGIILDEKKVLEYIDDELKKEDVKSKIINVETKKDKERNRGNKLLNKEEFKNLQEEIYGKVEEICKDIFAGKTDISPTEIGRGESKEEGCRYCEYRPICKKEVG